MESLFDNRPLLYSLAGAGGFVVMLALGKIIKLSTVSESASIILIFQAGCRSSVISLALWTSLMSLDPFSFRLEIFKRFKQHSISLVNNFQNWVDSAVFRCLLGKLAKLLLANHFQVLVTDAAAAFFLDRILLFIAGEGKLNIRMWRSFLQWIENVVMNEGKVNISTRFTRHDVTLVVITAGWEQELF